LIVIQCPHCQELRNEQELAYGGPAGVRRPIESATDVEWTDYLFMRANPKGVHREQWCCVAGCGQWFKVSRHTVTHEIMEILRLDQSFSDDPRR